MPEDGAIDRGGTMPTVANGPQVRRHGNGRPDAGRSRASVLRAIAGLIGLALWGTWWICSAAEGRLIGGQRLWIPALPFLGGDFVVHIHHVARVWTAGGDPYGHCDRVCKMFPYPPLVPQLLGWTAGLSRPTAMAAVLVLIGALIAAGTRAAWRHRRALGLQEIPLPLALAAVLASTPVVYTMERGQCDALILAFLVPAARLLPRRSPGAEVATGGLLATATWVKYYPGLILVGLLGLRRWRVLAAYLAIGAAYGLAAAPDVLRSLDHCRQIARIFAPSPGVRASACPWAHTFGALWDEVLPGTYLEPLAAVSGLAVAVALLLPMAGWLAWRVGRSPRGDRLAYPLLLWLIAAATFIPWAANDYNLFFLPMAAVAVWDRRDPAPVHMLMALMLLWWQPLWLPIGGELLLVFKLAGLVAVGRSLAQRATEAEPDREPAPTMPRPHAAIGARPA